MSLNYPYKSAPRQYLEMQYSMTSPNTPVVHRRIESPYA